MVKKWQELGFISNVQSKPMIFVETERTLLRNGLYTILNVTQNKFIGGTNDNDSTRPVGVVSLNHMASSILSVLFCININQTLVAHHISRR